MRAKGTGAELLLSTLAAAGVDTLFGLPGDTGVALYDALARAGSPVRHILARDERSAAFMADGYARATGRVGVVEASSGGGATYLVGGLGEPFAASIPILVITSDIHRRSRGSGAITEIDQVKLFSAVTKGQWVVEEASQMPALVADALRLALDGRPGPVSVIVPEDVLEEVAEAEIDPPRAELTGATARADRAGLATAARWLSEASRPAMVLGSGIHLGRAWEAAEALAIQAGLAVATSLHGKGAFPEDHPLSLGVAGANGARPYANAFLREADTVLFVGTRANATDTDGFRSPPRAGTRIIHLDVDPDRAGRNYPGSLALVGDARDGLAFLANAVEVRAGERADRVARFIAHARAALEAERTEPAAGAVDPRALAEAVRTVAAPGASVTGDPGTPTPYLGAYWRAERGRRSVLLPRGHGPMGYALPAAVGAALARPGHPSIAFTTDGSFGMACGELETVARLGLPVVCLHLANGSLGWIKALQHLYWDRRYFGVDFGPVDAARAAEAFGVRAVRAHTVADAAAAVAQALADARPVFIDVAVPEEFDHLPPVAPWLTTLVGALDRPVY